MPDSINRREFAAGTAGLAGSLFAPMAARGQGRVRRHGGTHLKLSLNAFSFNRPLRDATMSLDDVVDFCAAHGFAGLDATGYYFPGYPEVPEDRYVHALKRKAYVNGITIHRTGVRNDFAVADPESRRRDVQLVKAWIKVAAKLGAGVIRIFSGRQAPDGFSFGQVLEWMARDIRECADCGREHGVIVGLQHHHDFLKTAAETIRVVEAVNSEWFGVVLDVGSLRQEDPYAEIERLLPYAVGWQLKENVWFGDRETPVDLKRVKQIIDRAGFRGFLTIETLGDGDPRAKVARFLDEVRAVFG